MEFICDKKRHLVCIPYSKENLHKMAKLLGIKRCWFHKNHYDIPKRRLDEIQKQCRIVSSKEIVRILRFGSSAAEQTIDKGQTLALIQSES